METKPIGCLCHLLSGKCKVCTKLEDPRYSRVRVNLSSSRVVPGDKHLAPISLPIPTAIEVPKEVRELLNTKSNKSNPPPNTKTKIIKSPLTCIHGGKSTSNLAICPSCGGSKTKLKVFECDAHISCIVNRDIPGLQCCVLCNDYVEKR